MQKSFTNLRAKPASTCPKSQQWRICLYASNYHYLPVSSDSTLSSAFKTCPVFLCQSFITSVISFICSSWCFVLLMYSNHMSLISCILRLYSLHVTTFQYIIILHVHMFISEKAGLQCKSKNQAKHHQTMHARPLDLCCLPIQQLKVEVTKWSCACKVHPSISKLSKGYWLIN